MSKNKKKEIIESVELTEVEKRLQDLLKNPPKNLIAILVDDDGELAISTSYNDFNSIHGVLNRTQYRLITSHEQSLQAEKAAKE